MVLAGGVLLAVVMGGLYWLLDGKGDGPEVPAKTETKGSGSAAAPPPVVELKPDKVEPPPPPVELRPDKVEPPPPPVVELPPPPATCSADQKLEGTVCGPRCPDGTRFIRGTDGYAFIREGARHDIDDFCLDTTEVTVKAFRALSEESFAKSKTLLWPESKRSEYRHLDKYCNARYTNREDHPMNCVDWEQASTHCQSGGRLPTEWEWEWAARGRDEPFEYPWGNEPPTCDRAIFSPGSVDGCGKNRTRPVGSLKPESSDSKDGLHDMSGNVWEWTSSSYDGTDSKDSTRVLRGGGWSSDVAAFLRVSYRSWNSPASRGFGSGFRCARTLL